MIKYKKPDSFYTTFERKGKGQETTHYCPGCGHGTASKLMAEAIDDLELKDKTILCSPVGCSVFGYYYFDTGNIQCSHGRAAAVATAVKRTAPESIVISYQGDGDLAGIGLGAIVHAANRGENITVFFVNNAIYGMTGGQMAPTTLLGQKTTTTPMGRDQYRDGFPVKMAEMINTLEAPVYIERVSLATPAGVLKAKKVFKKALQNQVDKKGFSFVEILSPCPINWKMSPLDARKWITDVLEPAFPVGKLRDNDKNQAPYVDYPFLSGQEMHDLFNEKAYESSVSKKPTKTHKIKVAGFGGQGVLSAATLLSNCAAIEGRKTSWLPSYGPEMRGGTANASVIISDSPVGAPVVDFPTALIAMNEPSLDAFEDSVEPGGIIVVNSSLIKRKVKRTDLKVFYLPATEMASALEVIPAANIMTLTVYSAISGAVSVDTIKEIIPKTLKKKIYVDKNINAINTALKYLEDNPL